MIFIPENVSDIERYYKNTYVKFKECGDTLFHIQCVDSKYVSGKKEDGTDFILYLSQDAPYEIEYVLPHKSFFQYGNKAVLLERSPAKQYYRGLSPSNTVMKHYANGVKSVEFSFDPLKAFVTKQKFFSVMGAIQAAGMVTCVLSSRMMLSRATNRIFIDMTPVAKVSLPKMKIQMIEPIFFDEIVQLLRNTGEDGTFSIIKTADVAEKKQAKEDAVSLEEFEVPEYESE